MKNNSCSVLVTFISSILLLSVNSSYAQINLGLLGDSIVDDYLGPSDIGNTNLAAGSFGQIMAELRPNDFNFGGYKDGTNPFTGQWDNIRKAGYEYNFATAGAAANADAVVKINFGPPELLTNPVSDFSPIPVLSTFDKQVAGMSPLISSGNIDTAFISIGANDFFYHTKVISSGSDELFEAADGQVDEAFIDLVAGSILDGIDVLQAAGNVDIVLGLVPTIPIMTQEEIDGVAAVNNILLTEAAAKGVVLMDTQEWSISGDHVDPLTGDITVGHLTIPYGSVASEDDISPAGDGAFCTFEGLCPLDSHANYYISEDGIHLNTLMQGLLANEIIKVLNQEKGENIALLTDNELLGLVGVAPSAVPIPGAIWLFSSALLGLFYLKRK